MKYRALGRSGLRVSEVGFGAWAIGGSGYGVTCDEESLRALATAREQGVNFFDTADSYGHGHSESLIGRFLSGQPREEIILATKGGWDFYHGATRKVFEPGYIRYACEQSLKRLGTDYVDIYQLHNPSLDAIREGSVFDVLERLKKEGKIRFIGVSVHRESEALAVLQDGRIDCLQIILNLLDQRMCPRVLPEAAAHQTGLIIREPLASGVLTGKYGPGHEFVREDHRRRWTREKFHLDLQKVALLQTMLEEHSVPVLRAALEFVLSHQEISTVIPGAKSPAQVIENTGVSGEFLLSPGKFEAFHEIFEKRELFRQGLWPQ